MLPKKKLEWREGQNLVAFLDWLSYRLNISYTIDLINRLADMSDADFERLYNDFLAEGNEAKVD